MLADKLRNMRRIGGETLIEEIGWIVYEKHHIRDMGKYGGGKGQTKGPEHI